MDLFDQKQREKGPIATINTGTGTEIAG